MFIIQVEKLTRKIQVDNTIITVNPRGFASFPTEYKQYEWLRKHFFSKFKIAYLEQYEFVPGSNCIIDFYSKDETGKPTLIEVKNWFVSIADVQQIVKYLCHALEYYKEFNFILICGGIEGPQKILLEKLNVKVYLTKDLIEEYN